MGILFTILMGFLFTITIGKLFTIAVGIQLTISTRLTYTTLPSEKHSGPVAGYGEKIGVYLATV